MIAVDTSALMTILLHESRVSDCIAILSTSSHSVISAGTLAEVRVVAGLRGLTPELNTMLDRMRFEVVPVTSETSERIGRIYGQWGKGIHPAGLNFGDCFAYDVAKQNNCPLLFIGDDFTRTDIESAI